MPKALEPLEFPEEFKHVLDWYQDLEQGRVFGMNGPEPMTYQEIMAWALLKETEPTPFEVQVIRMLDASWRNTYFSLQDKQKSQKEKTG